MRLIDADKGLISKIQRETGCNFITAQKIVDSMPTVEERKVGKWIKYNTTEKIDMFGDRVKVSSYKCSECGRIISDISEDGFTNKLQDYPYCHCGAKMRGVENE